VRCCSSAGGSGGHDVGNYVVDADSLALGESAKGDLDLRHAVRVRVVFRILAEFLWRSASEYLGLKGVWRL